MITSLTIEEAENIIGGKLDYKLSSEFVKIEDSLNRIISRDVISECNVPGFKRSIMDGYAVNCMDLEKASVNNPVELRLVGDIEMGKGTTIVLNRGECAYIPTGGMLPEGADGILIIENAKKSEAGLILGYEKTYKGGFIVSENEDVSMGETVIKRGRKIRPYEMGVLSSIGCTKVEVYCRPKIGILSTGDEIVSPYEMPQLGQVRDINTLLLTGLINEVSCIPVVYNVKTDDYDEIFKATEEAIEECDIVLLSGGSSVGVKDQTLKVLKAIKESEILLHGLALKPGKPTIVALCKGKMVFGMPGHPLSCAVVFKTLVKFYLNGILGHWEKDYPVVCELIKGYNKTKGREEYIPVEIEERDGNFYATPIQGKSGIITTFSKAYGYFKTKKELDTVTKGEFVKVYKL